MQDMHGTHPHDAYILTKETDINKLHVSLQACAMKNYKTLCLFPCIWLAACHTLLCTDSPLFQPRHIKMTLSLCSRQTDTSADSHTLRAGKTQSQPSISNYAGSPPCARPNTAGPTPKAAPARLGWGWGKAFILLAMGG